MKTCLKNYAVILTLWSIVLVLAVSQHVQGQTTALRSSSFDMGFVTATGSNNSTVSSMLGETFVGASGQAATRVMSGFLADTLLSPLVGVKDHTPGPKSFSLHQNYPNPFNPSTSIAYSVPKRVQVVLRVYDLLGQVVATLVDGTEGPGAHIAGWNARIAPSGVYIYKLTAGTFVGVRKMVLLK